jgi:tetratricopeptide (TPR) repeat protein
MPLLDSSIALARRAGAGDADTLPTADYRAAILLFEGRTREAANILQAVEPRLRLAIPGAQIWVAFHDEQMGALALAQSRPDEALRYYDRAAAIWQARDLSGTPEAAGSECGRAVALRRLGRAVEAAPLLRTACSRYRQFGVHSRLLLRWAEEPS